MVTATGNQLQYSWLRNSIEIATGNQYTVAATTIANAGTYTIKVSNSGGVVSQNIVVTINPLLTQTIACTSSELSALHASAGIKTLVNGSYGACVPSSCVSGYSLYGNSCALIFCTTGAYSWTGLYGSTCSAPDQGTMAPGATLKVTYDSDVTWSSGSFTWTCPIGGGAAVASAQLCDWKAIDFSF